MAAAGFISVHAVFCGRRKPMVQCRYYVINLRILRSMEKIYNAFSASFLGLGWAGLGYTDAHSNLWALVIF